MIHGIEIFRRRLSWRGALPIYLPGHWVIEINTVPFVLFLLLIWYLT
jgi:hypothetical protein